MNYKESYKAWLENPYFDEKTREELIALKDNEKERAGTVRCSALFGNQ